MCVYPIRKFNKLPNAAWKMLQQVSLITKCELLNVAVDRPQFFLTLSKTKKEKENTLKYTLQLLKF